MKSATLSALLEARNAKTAVALVTELSGGAEAIVYSDGRTTGDLRTEPEIVEQALDALRHNRSVSVKAGDSRYFIHAFNPPLRLVIVGAVHIAQPLTQMASVLGYDTTIVDPRGAFATGERFPGVQLMDDWPDEALEKLGIDSRTAVVTLTHDPKLDDPALLVALRSDAFYVGSLGSKRTHASRRERLAEQGVSDDEVARIHAPIGLPLGGRAPSEIALAILAQMTSTLHGAEPK